MVQHAARHSALTDALSGKPAAATAGALLNGRKPTERWLGSPGSFPCLLWQRGDDDSSTGSNGCSSSDDSSSSVEAGTGLSIAGSAPGNTFAPWGKQLADFPVTPRSLRSGKEASLSSLGASAASVGGQCQRQQQQQLLGSSSLSRNYEAVIGSLPPGLSLEQRNSLRASVPASPARSSWQQLAREQRDCLYERSKAGQALRLSVLRGSVVVFVTAGYSGKRFIFEKCRALGVKAVVLDGPDSWSQLLVSEGVIERFIAIDFSQAGEVFDLCLQAIRQVGAALGGVDAVVTFCEMAVPLVARLAEALGLPGNTPRAVDAARDKHATRCCLAAAGLPTPRHARISIAADLQPAAAAVGFPAVIKPVAGAASIGVIRVDSYEQLQAAYARVMRDMARCKVVAGALVEGGPSDDSDDAPVDAAAGNASAWIKVELMLEEYLDGPEVDCDLVVADGTTVYGAVTDNWPTVEPYFNETGSNCPSILPVERQRELLELSISSVKALGFSCGVFHVEAKYTSRGPRLIEVNARMGGGTVRDINLLVWGVDLVEEHLLTAVGAPSRPPAARKPLLQLAEECINAKASGVLRDTAWLDRWKSHPDVIYAEPLVPAGSRVVCVADGLPTWVCELMVIKPTVQEAIDFMKHIEEELARDIPIAPLITQQQ